MFDARANGGGAVRVDFATPRNWVGIKWAGMSYSRRMGSRARALSVIVVALLLGAIASCGGGGSSKHGAHDSPGADGGVGKGGDGAGKGGDGAGKGGDGAGGAPGADGGGDGGALPDITGPGADLARALTTSTSLEGVLDATRQRVRRSTHSLRLVTYLLVTDAGGFVAPDADRDGVYWATFKERAERMGIEERSPWRNAGGT